MPKYSRQGTYRYSTPQSKWLPARPVKPVEGDSVVFMHQQHSRETKTPPPTGAFWEKSRVWEDRQHTLTHPVVVGEDDVDVDDLPGGVLRENIPLAVRGAVDIRVVVAALQMYHTTGKRRSEKRRSKRGSSNHTHTTVLVREFSSPRAAPTKISGGWNVF